jgi:hypothetical protein
MTAVGLRLMFDIAKQPSPRHCEERSDEAIHLAAATERWIAASPSAPRNDEGCLLTGKVATSSAARAASGLLRLALAMTWPYFSM